MSIFHSLQLSLTCLSIAANALFAGGIFTFPLLSPALALHLKLTQPQLTTIVLLGMVGQYPFAAIIGKVIDRYGPRACSLLSSFLFSVGFSIFAAEIAKTPDDITAPSNSSFRILATGFFISGLATASSYFSSLVAASRTFPRYLGAASGTSMALFGLSPLFLSLVASKYFMNSSGGLNVTQFVLFLAVSSGIVHLVGAINLRVPEPQPETMLIVERVPLSDEESSIDERQPLLPNKAAQVGVQVIPVDEGNSVLELFKDPYFWLLGLVVLFTLGSCEMVISNIGSIVLSLPSSSVSDVGARSFSPEVVTTTQVRLLSLSNTFSRLLSGPLADFISPVVSYLPGGVPSFPRKHLISRVAFLTGATLLLAMTFSYQELAIRSPDDLWILSIGTGAAYGTTFTILPSIISSIWGSRDFGRNFGVITYAPFFGTPIFSYLYAFVSAHNSVSGSVCTGVACWRLTFWVSTGASLVSCLASIWLWRRWKGFL
ncbi:MFS general substrate transporter [Gloeopeniophorella convolvens]|nr:MFS general substrate transporter [Gloeopeniophorella convolvens]